MPGTNRISSHWVYFLPAIALALAGCSAFSGAPPTGASSGRPVTAVRFAHLSALPKYAPIVPDRHGKSKTFEYVINDYGSFASIFKYPKSVAQVGSIYNVGGQGCTNVLYGYGKKTFWIVAGAEQISEYQVPQKLIKTLSLPSTFPTSCAMNTNGDLAVGIYGSTDGGDVAVFKGASGSPTFYATALDEEFFDGYDSQGDLFADGFTGNRSGFALVELPKGSTKFETIETSNSIEFPGSVQWDGTYITVFDQLANEMFQYTVSGTTATLKHTIHFKGSNDCAQTWIVKGFVYCGDAGNNEGEVFKYPQGGSPVAIFTGSFDEPLGVVAAEK